MRDIVQNPFRGRGLPDAALLPAEDPGPVTELLALCPKHARTPLRDLAELAELAGVARVSVKDERSRMDLGSFKALGAAYAIAHEAAQTGAPWETSLSGRSFTTASAGNHGISLAAGASTFGAQAIVFLAETVPESFAARLRGKGAKVIRAGTTYEQCMAAAEQAAEQKGWTLLSDSSWPRYTDLPWRVMEGYLQMAAEAVEQIGAPPTHILLQAGVGGLAAAVAAHARKVWGDAPTIVVVEPAAAPALLESIRAGRVVTTEGPVSAMGRLDCKTPSMVALAGLARDADLFVTVTEEEGQAAVGALQEAGMDTTPSGATGVAALLSQVPGLGRQSRVLVIVSEGAEDG